MAALPTNPAWPPHTHTQRQLFICERASVRVGHIYLALNVVSLRVCTFLHPFA